MTAVATGTSGLENATGTPFLVGSTKRMQWLEDQPGDRPDEGTGDSEARPTGFQDASEIYFFADLERYLASTGPSQKRLRPKLASHLTQSRLPMKRINQVLRAVERSPSENRVEAAIDLLSRAGEQLKSVARVYALSVDPSNSDAAFVLGVAAGRAEKSLIQGLLAGARNEAMREAAAELAVTLPKREARVFLRRLVLQDPARYVRERAAELLKGLD